MENNENNRVSFLVGEDSPKNSTDVLQDSRKKKAEKLKKPLIFALMTIVFAGCMYLIFKPSDKKKDQDAGLNDAVPQATDAGLQADKQKAYAQQLLEQKEQAERKALLSLSDYWSEDSTQGKGSEVAEERPDEDPYGDGPHRRGNLALNSYRNAQNTMGSFYQQDDSETQELRRQLEELKGQLAEKDAAPTANPIESQLALMEKSYQMAAKYLPAGNNGTQQQKVDSPASTDPSAYGKEHFVAFSPAGKNPVSALYREPIDSAFVASLGQDRNLRFYTAVGAGGQVAQAKNSVRACVRETQVVSGESEVKLRLLEPAKIPGRTLPEGTELTANTKFQNGRLQLKVSSIEWEGSFIPVDITVYNLDGQQGLPLPYAPEMNALTEIAANMSQTAGTSIMMTRSAGQQVAGDLSRGLVQGISGYFSKKLRTPKVTLKAGYQVLLVSKG